MKSTSKRDIVVQLSNEMGVGQAEVSHLLEALLDTITKELAQGNAVSIRNFGTFQVRAMKARVGRNPKKPDSEVRIPPRATVKFKPSKQMKERVARILPLLEQK